MKFTAVLNRKLFFTVLAACWFSAVALAAEPTALSLIKDANEYVGKDAKNQVVEIRSEKSIATLTPNIWYVVFFDPDATFKSTEVKFEAGKKTNVKRPFRVIEMAKADKVFDQAKLKTDSDEAIKIATSQPLLKDLTIKATQLWLESNYKADLSVTGPTWQVRLWAAKLRNPNDTAEIGDVYISAEDGKVIKTDLHIDRVD